MAEKPHASGRIGSLLRAFRSRNYRLFFAGQTISLIGTWLAQVAMAWLVYRLTGSTVLLGLVGFASQVPALLVGPFAGVFVDRWNLHRTLILTQTLAMLLTLALAWFVLAGTVTIAHILVLALLLGLVNGFDMPTRQAIVVQLVESRADLGNAIALNSSMVNAARLLGPSMAGLLIAVMGEGLCFLLDGLSYGAVVIALLMMRLRPQPPRPAPPHVLHQLHEGLRYAFGFPPIRAILLLVAVVSLVGLPYTVLMPAFARDILRSGPEGMGLLMGASGIGALAGGIHLASRRSVVGLGRWLTGGAVGFGISLIVFAFSRQMWLSMLALSVSGFAMVSLVASSNTILQTIVKDERRGRLMSLFTIAFVGMMPLGSLFAGALASPERLGPPKTVALGGLACLTAGLYFTWRLPVLREHVRPIYAQLGILPGNIVNAPAASRRHSRS